MRPVDKEKAKTHKNVSEYTKISVIAIKKIPLLKKYALPAKIFSTGNGCLSKYYNGTPVELTLLTTAIDLGFCTYCPGYGPIRITTLLLKKSSVATLIPFGEPAVDFVQSAMDKFVKITAETMHYSGKLNAAGFYPLMLAGTASVEKLSQIMPIDKAFDQHVASVASEYEWPTEVTDRYSVFLSCQLASRLIYNEEERSFSLTPSSFFSQQLTSNEKNNMSTVLIGLYENVMSEFESQIPALYAQYYKTDLMKDIKTNRAREILLDPEITDETLGAFLAEMTTKISNVVQSGNARVMHQENFQINLKEVSGMMGDAAFLATVLNKPELSQRLSLVSGGLDRALVGFEKTKNATSFLTAAAGTLSLISGIGGILGAIAFFSNSSETKAIERLGEQIECLGRQIEQLGKQLDCVLKNQMMMADTLIVAYKRINELHCRIRNFETATRKSIEFLATQPLIEALSSIDRYAGKKRAVSLPKESLHAALAVLEMWLRDHLPSEMMNGAVYAGVSAAESIDILLSLDMSLSTDKKLASFDISLSTNMIGFILKQLQIKGITIHDQYFKLPPLELYLRTHYLFLSAIKEINPGSDDDCQSFLEEFQERSKLFSELFAYLKQDDIHEKLLLLYLNSLCEVKKVLCELSYSGAFLTPGCLLHEQLNRENKIKKEQLFDALNAMEEIRLLLCILSQWTNHLGFFVSELPTRNFILTMTCADALIFKNIQNHLIRSNDDQGNSRITSLGNHNIEFIFPNNISLLFYAKELRDSPLKIDHKRMGIHQSEYKMNHRTREVYRDTYFYSNLEEIVKCKIYEPFILHFATDLNCKPRDEYSYCLEVLSVDNYSYKPSQDNSVYPEVPEFLSLLALFGSSKLEPLRYAYCYYAACMNNTDLHKADTLRPTVNPSVLLWIVAMLGHYEIFQSLALSGQFNFVAPICAEEGPWTDGYTPRTLPIFFAAKFNHTDVAEGMLAEHRRGNDIGLRHKDIYGRQPARIAFDYGHYQLANTLDLASDTLSPAERELTQKALEIPASNSIEDALKLNLIQAKRLAESYCI
ncbi:MAG: hypothetical protein A3E82_05645 [Gammaproteobacteria bacterium RIFCSPHIGHO2_12_FULL_38_11]|nr:MAG: hypothetical protein A3E82_05645 [Gammaproteobacteria bacterium RIFCSPHIGHO2_12_FULL_38_11]